MDLHRRMSFVNILALSLPLFCLLLSWASSTATTTFLPSPPPTPSSSILAAAESLRTRGYSLFSSALISTLSTTNTSPNFSATILAVPDFLFDFSPNPTRRGSPRRPTATLILYHTLQSPSLRWLNLTSLSHGDELPTLHHNYCLFLFKSPTSGVSISSSRKSVHGVNIRQPDLYVDGNLAIHGVDGLLEPGTGDKCSSTSDYHPTAEIQWLHRSFLDHAIRVLRRRGFHVAATALALRRPDLLSLPAVTVFVPSDKALFSKPDGFRFDFRRHVLVKRLRFATLMTSSDGMEYETLAPNKTVFFLSSDDAVSVNGVRVDDAELYHNQWIVLYSIPVTLDDVAAGEFVGKPSGDMSEYFSSEQVRNRVPAAAPESSIELVGPSSSPPGSEFFDPIQAGVPGAPPASSYDHIEETEFAKPVSPSPSPSPSSSGGTGNQCGVVSAVTVGVDGANLVCPVDDGLYMQENDDVQNFSDVASFEPSDDVDHYRLSKKLLQSEPLISKISDPEESKDGKGQVPDENAKSEPSNDIDDFHLSKKLVQSKPLISEISDRDEGKNHQGQVSDEGPQSGTQDPDPTNIADDLFYYT